MRFVLGLLLGIVIGMFFAMTVEIMAIYQAQQAADNTVQADSFY